MKQFLYRHFDRKGNLLYVGRSLNAVKRLMEHRDHSHWFDEIARVEMQEFDTREAVLMAERKAIIAEKPRCNVHHKWVESRYRHEQIEASKKRLVERIVNFQTMYSVSEAAAELKIGETGIKRLIENGKIGYVEVPYGEKTTKIRITGWQLIDYIENLDQTRDKAIQRRVTSYRIGACDDRPRDNAT